MLRRFLRSRLVQALLLGLVLVHAAPAGVIACSSESGLRFEFFCECSHGEGSQCPCGADDCSGELALGSETESCVCTDHGVELAGSQSAKQPRPQIQPVAVVPLTVVARRPVMPVHQTSGGRFSGEPPPLLAVTTVVLLI